MSDRIDHAAEALLTLGQIQGVDEQTNQITLALDAQVRATLALVEQQRIANRIALASAVAEASRAAGMHGSVIGLVVKNVGLFHDPISPDGVPPLYDDIREGLGLS